MVVTLEDVALFFGLPCSGEPIGAVDHLDQWRDILALEAPDFANSRGPTCAWLRKYNIRTSIVFS
jgi:hypothetical protein